MSTKTCDVLIEDNSDNQIEVWADKDLAGLIESIEGVSDVYTMTSNRYLVDLDKRYDRSSVIRDIENAIKAAVVARMRQ